MRPRHDRQRIQLGAQQTTARFVGRADNRFVFVKAGVEYHRDTGLLLESVDQPPVARVDVLLDGLQAPRAVDMGNGKNVY